jgi:hypothetical protein
MSNNLLIAWSRFVGIHPVDLTMQCNPNGVSLVEREPNLYDTIGWRQQHQTIQFVLHLLQIENQPARELFVRSPECGIERSECLFKPASERIDATAVAKNTHTLVNAIQLISVPNT